MAQWIGGYQGNTHYTRLEDAEQALREAVNAHHNANDGNLSATGTAVVQFAERVVFAREHLLRARLSISTHVTTEEALAMRERELATLRRKLEAVVSGGRKAVLSEFGVPELDRS